MVFQRPSSRLRGTGPGPKRDRLENLIADVEQKSQTLATEHARLERQNAELTKLIDGYESKLRVLNRELKEKRATALREAQQIIDQANALIESSVKEIKAQSAASDAIRAGKASVQRFKESLGSQLEAVESELSQETPTETISEGDFVNLRGHKGIGQVISSSGGGTAMLVEFEGIRMQVSRRDLVRTATTGAPVPRSTFLPEPLDVRAEIDFVE